MIKITFRQLLDDKNTTITKLSEKTGISRSTLTLLANGESKGIQFDTLEKICLALNASPNDFIEVKPDSFLLSNTNNFDVNSMKMFVIRVTPSEYVEISNITIADYETIENPEKITEEYDYSIFSYVYPRGNEYKIILSAPSQDELNKYDPNLSRSGESNDEFLSTLAQNDLRDLTIRISEFIINSLYSGDGFEFADIRTRFSKESDFNMYTYRKIENVEGFKKLYPIDTTIILD